MWPFRKPKPTSFQVIQPAGETYFVIKKIDPDGKEWELCEYSGGPYWRTWPGHGGANHYKSAAEAIEIVSKLPEFDTIVWAAHGGVVRDVGPRAVAKPLERRGLI